MGTINSCVTILLGVKWAYCDAIVRKTVLFFFDPEKVGVSYLIQVSPLAFFRIELNSVGVSLDLVTVFWLLSP